MHLKSIFVCLLSCSSDISGMPGCYFTKINYLLTCFQMPNLRDQCKSKFICIFNVYTLAYFVKSRTNFKVYTVQRSVFYELNERMYHLCRWFFLSCIQVISYYFLTNDQKTNPKLFLSLLQRSKSWTGQLIFAY